MEEYRTVRLENSDEFVEKKSRFIGYVKPVKTQAEAVEFINKIKNKHRDATHNVPAYVIRENNIQHSSDDGEPGGTAGVPVLDVLLKEKVCDVCVVVTRYFGGILLGAGGLVRAYSHAAKLALDCGHIITMAECSVMSVTVDYSFYDRLNVLLGDMNTVIISADYSDFVKINFRIKQNREELFNKKLTELSSGRFKAEKIGSEFSEITE